MYGCLLSSSHLKNKNLLKQLMHIIKFWENTLLRLAHRITSQIILDILKSFVIFMNHFELHLQFHSFLKAFLGIFNSLTFIFELQEIYDRSPIWIPAVITGFQKFYMKISIIFWAC
jgi:hypothetical protein